MNKSKLIIEGMTLNHLKSNFFSIPRLTSLFAYRLPSQKMWDILNLTSLHEFSPSTSNGLGDKQHRKRKSLTQQRGITFKLNIPISSNPEESLIARMAPIIPPYKDL